MANDRPFNQRIPFSFSWNHARYSSLSYSPLTPPPSLLSLFSHPIPCLCSVVLSFSCAISVAAPSRRGDLEVLGYCLLHWQCGTLPWLSVLRNPVQVQETKAKYAHFPFPSSFTGPETALGCVCGGRWSQAHSCCSYSSPSVLWIALWTCWKCSWQNMTLLPGNVFFSEFFETQLINTKG